MQIWATIGNTQQFAIFDNIVVQGIPEPATVTLLLASRAVVVLCRRMRRRA